MRRRGRPPYPDILTPREWGVLSLLREGLTNEQIASRLDVSLATARYHVSQILSKLGVATREDAAAWQPGREAPWRRFVGAGLLLKAAGVALAAAALVGVAVLAWGVLQTAGDEGGGSVLEPGRSPAATEQVRPPPLPSGHIVFVRRQPEPSPGVYQINPDGSGQTLLFEGSTDGSPTREPGVASPDNRWVAYIEGSGGLGYYGKLYISRADGGDLREAGSVEYSDALPSCRVSSGLLEWSPDSETLAFYSDPTGITLYAPGSGEIVARFPGTSVSWSPGGSELAATVAQPLPTAGVHSRDDECAVSIRNVKTGESRIIAPGEAPEWSPDGKLIAFSRTGALYTIAPGGTGEQRLAGYSDLPASTTTPFGVYPPALYHRWSPNGREIAVAIDGRVWVIDVATGEPRVLAEGDFPEWSPDGNWLVYWGSEEAPGATPDMYGYTRQVQIVYLIPANGTLGPRRLAEGEHPAWNR